MTVDNGPTGGVVEREVADEDDNEEVLVVPGAIGVVLVLLVPRMAVTPDARVLILVIVGVTGAPCELLISASI